MPNAKKFRAFLGKLEEKDGLQSAIRVCDDLPCATFREARTQAKKLFKEHADKLAGPAVAYVACDEYSPLAMAGIRREMIANFGEGFRVDVTPALAEHSTA